MAHFSQIYKERLKKIRVEILGALGPVYPGGIKTEELFDRAGSAITGAELMGVLRLMIKRGEICQDKQFQMQIYRLTSRQASERSSKDLAPAAPKQKRPKFDRSESVYGEVLEQVRQMIFDSPEPISGAEIGAKLNKSVQRTIATLRERNEIELAMVKGRSHYWRKAGTGPSLAEAARAAEAAIARFGKEFNMTGGTEFSFSSESPLTHDEAGFEAIGHWQGIDGMD